VIYLHHCRKILLEYAQTEIKLDDGINTGDVQLYMSKSIPLSPALGVQVVDVIIRHILMEDLDLMLEDLTIKGWLVWYVKG
jgi:hypothetical protein